MQDLCKCEKQYETSSELFSKYFAVILLQNQYPRKQAKRSFFRKDNLSGRATTRDVCPCVNTCYTKITLIRATLKEVISFLIISFGLFHLACSQLARPPHPIPQGFSSFLSKPFIKVVTQSMKLNCEEL